MAGVVARHVAAAVAAGRRALELLRVRLDLRSIAARTTGQAAIVRTAAPPGCVHLGNRNSIIASSSQWPTRAFDWAGLEAAEIQTSFRPAPPSTDSGNWRAKKGRVGNGAPLTRLLKLCRVAADAVAAASHSRTWCWANIRRKRALGSRPAPQPPHTVRCTGMHWAHSPHTRSADSPIAPSSRSPDAGYSHSDRGSSPCNAIRRCPASTRGCTGRGAVRRGQSPAGGAH